MKKRIMVFVLACITLLLVSCELADAGVEIRGNEETHTTTTKDKIDIQKAVVSSAVCFNKNIETTKKEITEITTKNSEIETSLSSEITAQETIEYTELTTPLITSVLESQKAPEVSEKKYGYIATYDQALNLREKPSKDSNIVMLIAKGERVEILNYEYGWYYVKYNDNYGYVYSYYVAIEVECDENDALYYMLDTNKNANRRLENSLVSDAVGDYLVLYREEYKYIISIDDINNNVDYIDHIAVMPEGRIAKDLVTGITFKELSEKFNITEDDLCTGGLFDKLYTVHLKVCYKENLYGITFFFEGKDSESFFAVIGNNKAE